MVVMNMKKICDFIPAIVIAFAFSFMLFIYEPVVMYLNNISDFWFDIYMLLSNSFIAFIALLLFILFIYLLIYLLQNKVFYKHKNIYNIILLIGFCLFFVTYIQGNYLSGSLPALDGKSIEWSDYKAQSIVSFILLIATIGVLIFSTIKFSFQKTIRWSRNITLAICMMLIVSLFSTCMTSKSGFTRKMYTTTATTKNISQYSSKKNLIILLLDSIDSETMENVVKSDDKYVDVFEDFTYYPDTVGAYPFTRDTVPLVLSGNWSENKKDFASFYNEAMDNSKLLDNLREKNYNINIYNDDISYNTEKARDIKNFSFDNKSNLLSFLKQEIKYDLFRYLPFYLKKYSRIESMNFIVTREMSSDELFLWDDVTFYNDYSERQIQISNDNEFKYIHLEGAHYPFDCDKHFKKKENGTYEDKIEASIRLIDKYLRYLKDNNVYDNSAIVILADHGFWWDIDDDSLLKRQNPILYIKGFNEKHERNVSDEKVSFDNLQDIYKELLDGKKTDKLFDNIDTSNPRRFLLYRVSGYDHMEEYLQYGHSKDLKTLKKTGNIYDLEEK